MCLNGVEALVVQHRLNETAGRRIPVDGRNDVGPKRFAEHRLIPKRVIVSLAYHVGRYVGMIQTLAHAMSDRGFKRVVMKDVLVDKGRELGLAASDVLRFVADTRPNR